VSRALALGIAAAAFFLAAPAQAARFAVGLEPGASANAVSARLAAETGGTVARDLLELRTLVLSAPTARGVAALPGVAWVERVDRPRRLAFTPTDPLAARQWYLAQIRAFDTWPERPDFLPGVKVAIVDSGLDAGHPEFEGRVVGGRSFVRGSWRTDEQGHGTFVAGLIAANADNGRGIAGLALPADLLVAKVIGKQRTISVEAEARAITWAANAGARVINLSLGGVRDPLDPARDTYSQLEAAAVSYAVKKGAVVVAAVGNADEAPERPWSFASYPAALPHVIGVSALARDGSIPPFSNRDKIYNDLAAPGQEIVSTFPRSLTRTRRDCANQGYSDCAPDRLRSYRRAEGTSFAAPLVAAAAALVLGANGDLRPDQVRHALTRSAVDLEPEAGCKLCPVGRDELSGWGRLDVTAAIARALAPDPPMADRREPNDDAGRRAASFVYGARGNAIDATLDFWDDQNDVYGVRIRPGQRLFAALDGPPGAKLFLWKPGTRGIDALSLRLQRRRVAQSVQRGEQQRFAYRVPPGRGGWYYLQVKLASPGAGPYRLTFEKS
jgi:subtilisin family serine protease